MPKQPIPLTPKRTPMTGRFIEHLTKPQPLVEQKSDANADTKPNKD